MCLLTPIAGQVESVQEPFGASLNFQYDAYGDRTLVTDSFSGQLTTNYNANSLATATTFTGGGITMEVDQSYNGSGQVTSQTMLYGGSAVVTGSWSYTPAGAVQSVAYQNSGASWNDTLNNAYNADGQVTSQADDLTISGSGSTTTTDDYGYDESGQLTSDNSATYNYDVNGNPTDVAGNTGNAATVGANNEMVSDTNWDYTYDNAGNLTQKTGVGANSGTIWTYGYDNANDLVSVCEYNDNTISTGHLEASGELHLRCFWQPHFPGGMDGDGREHGLAGGDQLCLRRLEPGQGGRGRHVELRRLGGDGQQRRFAGPIH